MEQKVCLDTDVVIAILNNEERALAAIKKIHDVDIMISTITLFELLLRKTQLEVIEIFRQKVEVIEFDEESARRASFIFKELQQKGRTIDIRDIFVAASCITTKAKLLTFNTKDFEHIDGLEKVQ